MSQSDEELSVPIIDPPPAREVPMGDSFQEQESDLYIARHNSLVNVLGSHVDGSLAEGDFDFGMLQKGLAFESVRDHDSYGFLLLKSNEALCNAVSGSLAIRGIDPDIPLWRYTLQGETSTPRGDALRAMIRDSRMDHRLVGSRGVDLNVDDGVVRDECTRWIANCGEKLNTSGEWWKEAASNKILDGVLVRADKAAQLYVSTQSFRKEREEGLDYDPGPTDHGAVEAPALLVMTEGLLKQTESIGDRLELTRQSLLSGTREQERRLLAFYCCLYPEEAQIHHITRNDVCPKIVSFMERVLGTPLFTMVSP
ncbi:unnamed protein product [Peniophora sp. CBMAI 1063]|nr:unnamed protein product [Peniophora sp. CBMAI 1063]